MLEWGMSSRIWSQAGLWVFHLQGVSFEATRISFQNGSCLCRQLEYSEGWPGTSDLSGDFAMKAERMMHCFITAGALSVMTR